MPTNSKAKSIGERYESDGFGSVMVVDVYVSPTSQDRVYMVRTNNNETYLVTGGELYDTPQDNWKVITGE